MQTLNTFTLVAIKRPIQQPAIVGKRDKLLAAIAEQIEIAKARVVFLPAKLRGCIAEYVKGQGVDGWLFTSQKREKFSANTLQATMTGLYERAGFTDCTSHTGRRSFLTKLATQGVTARVLQELAGHKNLATTQRYIDVNDDMKRSALLLI